MAIQLRLDASEAPANDGYDVPTTALTRRQRARTVSMRRLSKRDLALESALYPASLNAATPRPVTSGECEPCPGCQAWRDAGAGDDTPAACGHDPAEAVRRSRPCVFVGCVASTYLDVNEESGSIKYNFPGREPEDMPPDASCVLDLVERGGLTLEETGDALNVTRERVRQIETRALRQLAGAALAYDDLAPEDDDGEATRHHGVRRPARGWGR